MIFPCYLNGNKSESLKKTIIFVTHKFGVAGRDSLQLKADLFNLMKQIFLRKKFHCVPFLPSTKYE